jgi:hypothetical protein
MNAPTTVIRRRCSATIIVDISVVWKPLSSTKSMFVFEQCISALASELDNSQPGADKVCIIGKLS